MFSFTIIFFPPVARLRLTNSRNVHQLLIFRFFPPLRNGYQCPVQFLDSSDGKVETGLYSSVPFDYNVCHDDRCSIPDRRKKMAMTHFAQYDLHDWGRWVRIGWSSRHSVVDVQSCRHLGNKKPGIELYINRWLRYFMAVPHFFFS